MEAYMVIGGQWGSEGKGLFAGFIAKQKHPDGVVCQFGPNAGHTWLENRVPIVFKSLPVASIRPDVKAIYLGPGSVINPEILEKELDLLKEYLKGKDIFVHEAAAILTPEDTTAEMESRITTHIASTRQGTAEAMIRKIRRGQDKLPAYAALKHLPVTVLPHVVYINTINSHRVLQVEGSQGMDLSINGGFYPFTTSRDCTPAQVMADCGLHPWDLSSIYVCLRTFPIRVGNIKDGEGNMIGYSGPHYPDQREMTWDMVGQAQEFTTVTKRVRRVFSFSDLQTKKMLQEIRPNGVFLNFCNYLHKDQVEPLVKDINRMAGRHIVRWTGWGPNDTDICVEGGIYNPITPPVYGE